MSQGRLLNAQEEVRRWKAEQENASARLQLARAKESRAFLMSQAEPVNSLGIDRDVLGVLLAFTVRNDKAWMERELAALPKPEAGDWIAWGGGDCPVPAGTLVDYKLRDGTRGNGQRAGSLHWANKRSGCWSGLGIIAYRVVE